MTPKRKVSPRKCSPRSPELHTADVSLNNSELTDENEELSDSESKLCQNSPTGRSGDKTVDKSNYSQDLIHSSTNPTKCPNSKLHYYNKPSQISTSGCGLNVAAVICGLLAIGGALYYFTLVNVPRTSKNVPDTGDTRKHESIQFFKRISGYVKSLNLYSDLEHSLLATYEEMHDNVRPVVMMIISQSKNPRVECFLKKQIDHFKSSFEDLKHNSGIEKTDITEFISNLQKQCIGNSDQDRCFSNSALDYFIQSLSKSGILWLDGLENLMEKPGIILALNSLADHKEARYKRALIFLTATINSKIEPKGIKSFFREAWSQRSCPVGDISCMTTANFLALWTRIGEIVINAKAFEHLVETC